MSEAKIQSDCVKWLWNSHPETRGLFFSVTNNSEHIGRAMQRKSVGLVSGVSDTIFLWDSKTYLIEFKTETGKQSSTQKRWEESVNKQGFQYFIIRSLEEFQRLMIHLMNPQSNQPTK